MVDLVLVKLLLYRQQSITLRKNQKLSMRYFGPFRVHKKLNDVAFQLELPIEARIHDVFHIFVLKPFRGDNRDQYLPLPLQTTPEGPMLSPHVVIKKRTVLRDHKS